MKRLAYFYSLLLVCFLVSCVKTDNNNPEPTTTTDILVTNPWKVDRITDLNGNVINSAALPTEAKAMFGINIQFNQDKTVRAIDPVAKSVVNGGTWDLLDNNQILDIDVSQLKGKFPINQLSRSRMTLKYNVTYNGVTFNVNLELVPAL